jgi:hypothetical protein
MSRTRPDVAAGNLTATTTRTVDPIAAAPRFVLRQAENVWPSTHNLVTTSGLVDKRRWGGRKGVGNAQEDRSSTFCLSRDIQNNKSKVEVPHYLQDQQLVRKCSAGDRDQGRAAASDVPR